MESQFHIYDNLKKKRIAMDFILCFNRLEVKKSGREKRSRVVRVSTP